MRRERIVLTEIITPEAVEAGYGTFTNYMHKRLKEFEEAPGRPELVGKVTASVEGISSGEFIRFTLEGEVEVPDDAKTSHWNLDHPKTE